MSHQYFNIKGDSGMDDQSLPPLPTYTTYRTFHDIMEFDPPPPYIPRYVQSTEPVRDLRAVLIDQMDGWLEELDNINWTVKNAQPVSEHLPRYPGTDDINPGPDSDLESDKTLDHEPGYGFGPDDKASIDHARSHGTEPDAGENENENYHNDTSQTAHSDSMSAFSEGVSDDEGRCLEELSAVVNNGWARLKQLQDHMASVKHSLSEDSDFYNILL